MIDRKKVAKSVNRFLDHQSRERDDLRRTLEHIANCLEDTVIFGGMIREFALGNTRNFKSDIDIVSRADSADIFAAIKDYRPIVNKFGGYRFIVGKQLYDIWSFDDTWAFKNGLVEGSSLQDIFKTTFFNLDAAVFHLGQRELFWSESYVDSLKDRVLDLNLQENPSPAAMVRRAIKLAIGNELSVTPRLAEYIVSNVDPVILNDVSSSYVRNLKTFLSEKQSGNFSFSPQGCLFPYKI